MPYVSPLTLKEVKRTIAALEKYKKGDYIYPTANQSEMWAEGMSTDDETSIEAGIYAFLTNLAYASMKSIERDLEGE